MAGLNITVECKTRRQWFHLARAAIVASTLLLRLAQWASARTVRTRVGKGAWGPACKPSDIRLSLSAGGEADVKGQPEGA